MKSRKYLASLVLLPLLSWTAAAAEQPGITDKEIKFGNIMPYSGPASALGVTGKVFSAYFDMINEKGGVNGRKLTMISLDDAFSPPKTMEATRRLVESDGVAFMFGTMGTAPSSATAKYLNGAKVPHLFLISSASKWNEPATQPWLMALPWAPNYMVESGIEVRYALAKNPNARFAVLYQNDDAGKEYLRGVKEALGADADKALAMAASFEVADPTVDSQIVTLASTKADVFLIYSVTPRGCAQAIRKAQETGWRPMRFISSGCANKDTVMAPAGLDAAEGIMSVVALKPYTKDSKGSGVDRLRRIHEGAAVQCRARQLRRRIWLHGRAGAGRGAGAVQGQSQPRQHHGAGRQPQERIAVRPAPRHYAQHLGHRLPPDQGRLHGPVPRRAVRGGERDAARELRGANSRRLAGRS